MIEMSVPHTLEKGEFSRRNSGENPNACMRSRKSILIIVKIAPMYA